MRSGWGPAADEHPIPRVLFPVVRLWTGCWGRVPHRALRHVGAGVVSPIVRSDTSGIDRAAFSCTIDPSTRSRWGTQPREAKGLRGSPTAGWRAGSSSHSTVDGADRGIEFPVARTRSVGGVSSPAPAQKPVHGVGFPVGSELRGRTCNRRLHVRSPTCLSVRRGTQPQHPVAERTMGKATPAHSHERATENPTP